MQYENTEAKTRTDFKLIYNRKKGAKKNNETAIIEIRATLQGTRIQKYYSTKIKVTPLEWHEKNKKVIKNTDAERHNFYLDKYISELKHLQHESYFKDQPFTFDDVKAYFKQKKEKTNSFISFVNSEIDTDLSVKTKAQHRNTINILKKFITGDILFNDSQIKKQNRVYLKDSLTSFKYNHFRKSHFL